MRAGACAVVLAVLGGCAGDPAETGDGGGDAAGGQGGQAGDGPGGDAAPGDGAPADGPGGGIPARAREVAKKLRGGAHFMFGLGNDLRGAPDWNHDLDGIYSLGPTLDLHDTYLTGYSDMSGWPTWNAGGTFVNIMTDSAAKHGVTPMFTYYALALALEQGKEILQDETRMHQYLLDVRLMYERLAAFGKPAVVHFEPDFFGYLQGFMSKNGTTPDAYAVKLHLADFHDCDALPETAHGFGRCLVHMARALAPQVVVGFAASQWADWYDVLDAKADIEGKGASVGAFLRAMGGDEADVIVVETLDRDAGFWETSGGMAGVCSVKGGPRGAVYWDESGATLPNFSQHLRWVKAVGGALGMPALWWQMPLGVPSATCGGTDGHYRDNRVHYFFAHVPELIASGGVGCTFGVGAGRQTTIETDGGQFKTAVGAYFASPAALP